MSNANKGAVSAQAIDAVLADNAELRAAIVALAQGNRELQEAVKVALAPKTRAVRAVSAPATVSEGDRVCAEGGFRGGYRAKLVRTLVSRGPGVYTMQDLCEAAFPGYPARPAIEVAKAVGRRLGRLPRCGYTLIVDTDEADAGKTELDFAARAVASDTETV